MRTVLLAPVAALLLAACGSGQRVERPYADAYMSLLDMRSDANAMPLATRLPGTSVQVERGDEGEVIWRFDRQGQEYGRFIARLEEDGPGATRVRTRYEPAPTADNLGFLHQAAQAAAAASVAAALAQRPVDMAAVEQQISRISAANPLAAQTAVIETVSDEIDARAPPDPCESEDRATRERCETLERNRGRGGSEAMR